MVKVISMHNKSLKNFIIFLFFCVCFIYPPKLYSQTYGLKFQGQDVSLDKRTELNLTPNDFLQFQDEFEISFDYKIDLIEPNSTFGYVFRVVNKENFNVDLLSTPTPQVSLNIVIGKSNSIIPVSYPPNAINNWINLRIKFIMSEDRMIFYTPDTFYVQEEIGFKKQDAFKIIFGANDYNQFKTTDVPSINIKNVKLIEKGKLKYHWPLDHLEGNIANDKIKNKEATVINPDWLMLSHQSWQSRLEAEISGPLLVASDPENNKIFIVGTEELTVYSAEDNTTQKIVYQNKPNFLSEQYRAIYNENDKKIYCYLLDSEPFYSLDIETGKWSDSGVTTTIETSYRHHNRFYNANNNSIYALGGYGFHKYNNKVQRIDLNENKVYNLPTNDKTFLPRYIAGLGTLNDTAYILGGYGSESGDQRINPQSYYDLIGYSAKDNSFFKKFEIPRIIDDMAVANSMWIDENTRDYYALIFEKSTFDGYLQLVKGNLGSPEIEILGNKIPFQFLDIRSYASLFYMPKQNKLFAYTSYLSDENVTQAKIFSISYPPNKFKEETLIEEKLRSFAYLYYILVLFVLSGIAWFVIKRKKKSKNHSNNLADEGDALTVTDFDPKELIIENPVYQLIYFGGFQVFNKDFADITSKFSPLLKELYLLIVLHTFKNNKGISSDKITEILWYDKSEKSARNNRAVNIAKLRAIMAEIGSCELTKKTGYWKITPDDKKIKSDYVDFLNLTVSKTNLTKQKVNQLINITQKGAFLLNVHYDWLDEFKASISDTVVDTLVTYGESCDIKEDAEFIVHLADSVFNFDVINEDAMKLKCRAEYCLGKHSLAKATYEKFSKEYKIMYNQEYIESYLKILEIKE